MSTIISSPTDYTFWLAIATFTLALFTAISIWQAHRVEKARRQLELIKRKLEEFYIPLFNYFKEYPKKAGEIDVAGLPIGLVVALSPTEKIADILREKGYLSDFKLPSKKFEGTFSEWEGKAHWEGWDVKEEDVDTWRTFGKNLYKYYRLQVEKYYKLSHSNSNFIFEEPNWDVIIYHKMYS